MCRYTCHDDDDDRSTTGSVGYLCDVSRIRNSEFVRMAKFVSPGTQRSLDAP